MKRREFLAHAAGWTLAAGTGRLLAAPQERSTRRVRFQRWRSGETSVPVTRVTPGDGEYVHTYYDVCPFSPSGRYLATTRLPFADRAPVLGDTADVCVIDLQEETIRTVYSTRSWGFQTGAHAQWGATDRHLYTNDVVNGRAVCVRVDLESDEATAFSGPMYHIAPDESAVIGFPLELLDVTQRGYGVPAKDPDNPQKLPPGASTTQGLWRTDLSTGETSLLVSIADVAATVPEPPPKHGGTFYFWHSKFNRRGTRIMQVLRCLFPSGYGGRNAMVVTYRSDGSDIRFAPQVPIWGAAGGHPNWHPDGVHLLRVLEVEGTRRFCLIPANGDDFRILSEKVTGGGHPTFESSGRYLVTDRYHGSRPQLVSIELVDFDAQESETIATLPTLQRGSDLDYAPHRLDGHPAWSGDWSRVCFQAAPDGKRQLYVADVERLLF